MTEIEIVLTETSKQPSVVEVDEVTITPDPSIPFKVPISKPSLSVAVVQPVINLEEEPVAIDAKEELEAAAKPTTVLVSKLVFVTIVVFYFLVRP